jgi:hypothetical protein
VREIVIIKDKYNYSRQNININYITNNIYLDQREDEIIWAEPADHKSLALWLIINNR